MNRALLAVGFVFLLAGGRAGYSGSASQVPPAQGAQAPASESQYVGSETCMACHDPEWQGFSRTEHSRAQNPRTPLAARGCETCHGPGSAHVEGGGDISKIRVFPKMAPREVSEVCTTCHNRGDQALWRGSMHDSRNLSCVTCHSIHRSKSEQGQLKTATQVETCAACHRPQVLKLQRTAHMPVREGKLVCTSCHNPHGSTNLRLLKVGNYINESCVSCHTEKRGPFLIEHPPGRESCVTCHDPHGSSNERLLVAKVPMLCQRCHIGTRHPSTIYDNKAVQTSVRLFGRGCVQCHENIHGSNSPSGNTFHR
jgi:DmsE family decaheme c-type cytochrome